MGNYKKGDKFIVEIEDIYAADDSANNSDRPTKLYRMKGFNSLVFDQNGLKHLTRFEPPTEGGPAEKAAQFDNGVRFAENAYKKLCELSQSQLINLFGYISVKNIISNIPFFEIYKKVSASEDKIVVGDVVQTVISGPQRYFLVTSVGSKLCSGLFQNGFATTIPTKTLVKTRFNMKRVDAWLGSQGQEVIQVLIKEESDQCEK